MRTEGSGHLKIIQGPHRESYLETPIVWRSASTNCSSRPYGSRGLCRDILGIAPCSLVSRFHCSGKHATSLFMAEAASVWL